jgi:tetratricopeptide (TPR) repeat protein
VPDTCRITKPGDQPFVPPPPYPSKSPAGALWFGTDRLWTILEEKGAWEGLPHYTPSDPTFRQVLFWWRQGYDWDAEPRPPLTVTGRSLDAPAPPLMVDPANGGYREEDWKSFMVVGINLPTLGCWEITGHYGSDELTFVVWVAESALQSKRWTEADRKAYFVKAQQGDIDAQFWLGTGYEQGWFGRRNFQEALKWLRKAAAQGNPDAQNALGQMYEDGEGVQRDYVRAAYWYRKAAEQVPDRGGAGQGRNNLGLLYMDGLGVPQDYVQAYMWFSLTNFEKNRNLAKARMSPAQILEAERMAAEWKHHHPER